MNASTSVLTAPLTVAPAPALRTKPDLEEGSAEMRRFSAGLRAIAALLCTFLLVSGENRLDAAAVAALLGYDLWAGALLWAQSRGWRWGGTLAHYTTDVIWAVGLSHLSSESLPAIALTLVLPVLQAGIVHGTKAGIGLALGAALGLMLAPQALLTGGFPLNEAHGAQALAVFSLGPAAVLLAQPLSVLHRSHALVRTLESGVDPRRGLDALSVAMVEQLRQACEAPVLGLFLPALHQGPALLSTPDDGAFPLEPQARRRIESRLRQLPAAPVSRFMSGWVHRGMRLRLLPGFARPTPPVREAMDELAALLQVSCLVVVPLLRYERVVGHVLLGGRNLPPHHQDVAALAKAAPELARLVERAALIDQLQEESAAHERMRIGRDLHDSAIQPYLGLKYAVEALAMSLPDSNPARADLLSLQDLVNSEIDSLRELVSGLRAGEPHGDNALIPAVQRQTRRFTQLFGIEVHLHGPEQLPTTRTLAGAVFHMVNEALTNVRKHTPATRVDVRLVAEHGRLLLAVRDDAGSVLGQPLPDFRPRSLAERAASLGGTLVLTRPDGLNTEILVTVPLQTPGSFA